MTSVAIGLIAFLLPAEPHPNLAIVTLRDLGMIQTTWHDVDVPFRLPATAEHLEVWELESGQKVVIDVQITGLQQMRQTTNLLKNLVSQAGAASAMPVSDMTAGLRELIAKNLASQPAGPLRDSWSTVESGTMLLMPSWKIEIEVDGVKSTAMIYPSQLDHDLVMRFAEDLPKKGNEPKNETAAPRQHEPGRQIVVEICPHAPMNLRRAELAHEAFKSLQAKTDALAEESRTYVSAFWGKHGTGEYAKFLAMVPEGKDRLTLEDLDPAVQKLLRSGMVSGLPRAARAEEFWQKAKITSVGRGVGFGMFFKSGQVKHSNGATERFYSGQVFPLTPP